MKKLQNFICVLLSILLVGCASTLNSRYQKVTVHTTSDDSKVYLNNKFQGEGEAVVVKMKRDRSEKQIKVENKGYKDRYEIHYQDHRSPLYFLSWVPFGVFYLLPPMFDNREKGFDHPRHLYIKEEPIEILKKTEELKYLYVKNTSFDVKKEDLTFKRIKKKKFDKNKKKYINQSSGDKDIEFDNTIFNNSLNEILIKNNFADTTNTIFKKKSNTAYLSASIKKVNFEEVFEVVVNSYQSFVHTDLEIEWTLYDLYDQKKYSETIKSRSGNFCDFYSNASLAEEAINDAIETSFLTFINKDEVVDELKMKDQKEEKFENNIELTSSKPVTNLEQAIKSTVTVKVDKGHGSGCVISKDGYILTNFHVISGLNENLTILTNDGNEIKAEIIRKNEAYDLAIIKVDAEFEYSYRLPSLKKYSIGEEVFTIGTPSNIELGQTVSKGIISGFRSNNDLDYIQTDASVNPGNSGGALVNKKGEIVGVVNAKLFGFGLEGLGFAIPAENVKKFLSLE